MKQKCVFCKKELELKKIYGKDRFGKNTFWYIGGKHDCLQGKEAAQVNNYLQKHL